jgi:hypothetical protein
MFKRRFVLLSAAAATVFALPTMSSAAINYTNDFNSPAELANWTVNNAPTANASLQSAEFGYDYGVFGIPAAPGGVDTLGLRLRANIPGGAASPVTSRPAGVTSGLSVSPTGQNFGATYQATFYAWANFNGAPNASGLADNANSEGGTNNLMFGIGTSGTVPLVVGNTGLVTNGAMDAIGFATSGDGGITNDYRVYPTSGTISAAGSGVYAANSTANTNAYYTNIFPSTSAPIVQQALSTAEYGGDASNTQAGSTQAGAFGFAWHKVVLTKDGPIVSWDVDGWRLATIDTTSLTLGGANIAFGVSDVNTTTTRHPSLLFGLIDNLTVTDTVPEPASLGLLMLGGSCFFRRARRDR